MEREDLVKLVDEVQAYQCETQTLEVKAAHDGCPTRLYDTLSSFSNQDSGGIFLFGLDERQNYQIVGVYDPQDLQHRVAEQCKQMEPAVRPLFTVCDIDGKAVVSAEVPGMDVTQRPVYYSGKGRIKGSFIRVGEADEPMSDYEIYSYDAYHRRIRDDIRVAELADVSQLDVELLERYITAAKENKPNTAKLTDDEILQLMGIVRDSKPTLAGVMCFSKYPQAAFPQLCITAIVVPGIKMGGTGSEGERFIANKRIEGTIQEMLEEAIVFLQRNMRVRTIIDDNGKRNDKTEYPVPALREAILNALMHRDYSIYTEGTPVRIIMYNDRVEIVSEGGLYGRLTIDSLGQIHPDTRNQVLANILEVLKIAENRYSGIPTIRDEMEAYGLPEPIFENRRGSFVLTLKNGEDMHVVQHVPARKEGKLLAFCATPRSREEIAAFLGLTQYYAMKNVVEPLVEAGQLILSIPDKPKSRNQRYSAAPG